MLQWSEEMTALERVAELLRNARVYGGWTDEGVAAMVLTELGLDDNGSPIKREPQPAREA
jgi:hypothetical protein